MLAGLLQMEGGDRMLPFVILFYSNPSVFFMRGYCSVLGQHAALFAVAERLEVGDFSLPWMTCA